MTRTLSLLLLSLWATSFMSVDAADEEACPTEGFTAMGPALLARNHRVETQPHAHSTITNDFQTCTPLINRGAYFSIDVEVGTPPQTFSVVADTGSNILIIPSCVCQTSGFCTKKDRCFVGTGYSTSFDVPHGPSGKPQDVLLSFGSGTIEGVVAKDTVRVGNLSVFMKDGLVLMTAHHLNFGGSFEGILGLGIPPQEEEPPNGRTQHSNARAAERAYEHDLKGISEIFGGGNKGRQAKPASPPSPPVYLRVEENPGNMKVTHGLSPWGIEESPDRKREERHPNQSSEAHWRLEPIGFLEQAGISRFSMCFNDGADGVLRLGTPKEDFTHGSIGKEHWGVDFRGVSIGDEHISAKLTFCDEESMVHGQKTPCGAIPDSGTTAIMAPKEHIDILLAGICDNWLRCKENHTALVKAGRLAHNVAQAIYGFDPWVIDVDVATVRKQDVLNLLLSDCNSWIDEKDGMAELPLLHFHVRGSSGTNQTLTLPGHIYVMELMDETWNLEMLERVVGIPNGVNKTDHKTEKQNTHKTKNQRSCAAAFSEMDYITQQNGPVWILGTPLFYQFAVGYDLSAMPPGISFTSTYEVPCGSCKNEMGLVGTDSRFPRRPRLVDGPLRTPSIDVSRPL